MDPARRFAELIDRPAASAHLDVLCGLISATMDPRAQLADVVRSLDDLAERCPPNFEGVIDTLFAGGMFTGDTTDYHDPRNSLIHEVLVRRIGMPITLSVVAIEVGRRLGVGILGIGFPGHFVVRDARSELYADPFGGGVRYDRANMLSAWTTRMGASAPSAGMMAPVPSRAIVLRILNNLKHSLIGRDDPIALARLGSLRLSFEELAGERDEVKRWMRHWN